MQVTLAPVSSRETGVPVEWDDLAQATRATDRLPEGSEGLLLAALGLVGEAGDIASCIKRYRRDGRSLGWLQSTLIEEFGDLLWYVGALARRGDVGLGNAISANQQKTEQRMGSPIGPLRPQPATEVWFPNQMTIHFVEEAGDRFPIVAMRPGDAQTEELAAARATALRSKGVEQPPDQIGDVVDDNARDDLGYRFHDVIHLAHAAVLGWSPVLRSLLGLKRKESIDQDADRVDDGARAIAVEEGLAAFVFSWARDRNFDMAGPLDWELAKHIKRSVAGLEVERLRTADWARAYRTAFAAFMELRSFGGGIVVCDLIEGELEVRRPAETGDD